MLRSSAEIVGARPSVGKSSFALGIARNAAVTQGAKVVFYSLEMFGPTGSVSFSSNGQNEFRG